MRTVSGPRMEKEEASQLLYMLGLQVPIKTYKYVHPNMPIAQPLGTDEEGSKNEA